MSGDIVEIYFQKISTKFSIKSAWRILRKWVLRTDDGRPRDDRAKTRKKIENWKFWKNKKKKKKNSLETW